MYNNLSFCKICESRTNVWRGCCVVGAQRSCDVCHVRVRGRCIPCEHLYCERCAVTNHQSSRCVVCGTTIGMFAMDV